MPELPEVETIVRELQNTITGKAILKIWIEQGYKVQPNSSKFSDSLEKSHIEKVERLAKNIVITLFKKDFFLVFHLAMTGRILLRNISDSKDAHTRVKITFVDQTELRFCDVRMFGSARILSKKELITLKQKYGPSPFHKDLTASKLMAILSSKNTIIKRALLEQELISGLGNIYANDSLFMAKIHPEAKTRQLIRDDYQRLLSAMKQILLEGIKHKGSTLDDEMFVDIWGKKGEHQNFFRIYGKDNKPCPSCNGKILVKSISQRPTYFCPNCQLLKRETKQGFLL
ncbi:MAG: DNA-formamidopyrimidine glycosylase [Patescibacteria group bacterium]